MPSFEVRVTIENRPGMRDPEGETILRDLVMRHEGGGVAEIRTARLLRFRLEATDAGDARRRVAEMCERLRIYNPLVSQVSIEPAAG